MENPKNEHRGKKKKKKKKKKKLKPRGEPKCSQRVGSTCHL